MNHGVDQPCPESPFDDHCWWEKFRIKKGDEPCNGAGGAGDGGGNIADVKIILAGEITRPMTVKGLKITKGAQAAVEAAGGKVEV